MRIAAIILGAAPVVHTEWNKYRLKRFEKITGKAAELDPNVKAIKERRARAGSEWKFWKSLCIGLAILLGATSFFLARMS